MSEERKVNGFVWLLITAVLVALAFLIGSSIGNNEASACEPCAEATPSPIVEEVSSAGEPAQCTGMNFDTITVGTPAGDKYRGDGDDNLFLGVGGGDDVRTRGGNDCVEVFVGSDVRTGSGDDVIVSHGVNAAIRAGSGYDKCYTNNVNGLVRGCEEIHPL